MTDLAPCALAAALARWREIYWGRPLTREACAAMAEKYAALAAVEAMPPGKAQDAALRAAARRWPGCLRESQLAGPERCRQRLAQASAGRSGPLRARAHWRDEGGSALVLWADLHPLLADLVVWRQTTGGRAGVAGLVAFAAASGRWPDDPALLVRIGGAQVRTRMAYAWLAAQAGMELPALNWALFGRTGPWDRRAGDPSPLL